MEKDAFLQAIVENPDDDAPRLVYADWLDEHGQPERADLIRVQCELARLGRDDARRPALERREGQLLRADNRKKWFGRLNRLAEIFLIRRGFPEKVSVRPSQFPAVAEELFRLAPVRELHLNGGTVKVLPALVACPHLARLTRLYLHRTNVRDERLGTLARSPHLKRLTGLSIGPHHITRPDTVPQALAPLRPHLRELHIYGNRLRDEGAASFAACSAWTELTSLDLCGSEIGDVGAEALAVSGNVKRLTSLRLAGNLIGDAGVIALATSPNLAGLSDLDLSLNWEVGDDGAHALAVSPYLTGLRSLRFCNHLSEQARERLREAFGERVVLD